MLSKPYFYNGTIRKAIAVFGSLFNDIEIRRRSGTSGYANRIRVPLSLGPREHFLARLDARKKADDQVAIRLPRMSFEISGISIDTTRKLNKFNKRRFVANDSQHVNTIWQSVPYNLSIDLSIYAKEQEDGLQIFEQILPVFTPEFVVSMKDLECPGSMSDVPIILNSTNLSNEYAGDVETTRGFIENTLNFTMKIMFSGWTTQRAIIRDVDVDFFDLGAYPNTDSQFYEELGVEVDSQTDSQFLGIDQSDDDTFDRLYTMDNN